MGASPLRLLSASAALAVLGALLSVDAAAAAPAPATTTVLAASTWSATPARVDLVRETDTKAGPETQGQADDEHVTQPVPGSESPAAPPIGLLSLLVPILLAGGIAMVLTLRRLA